MKTALLTLLLAINAYGESGCPTPRIIIPNPFDATHACEAGSSKFCIANESDLAEIETAKHKCGELFPEKPCVMGLVRFPDGRRQVVCDKKLQGM